MTPNNAPRPQVQPIFGIGPRGPMGPGGGFGQTARAKDAQGTLHRLWGYLRRQRWLLVAVVILVLLTTGLSLLGPYLMGLAIDRFILAHDLPGLARLIVLMLVSYAALSLTSWLQTILMIRAAQGTVRDLRRDLFAKLQTLSLRFFDGHTHGELMSRLTNDVENVNTVLTNSVTSFISSIFTLVGVIIVMLAVNVPLALVSLIVVPLMAYLTRYIARNSRQGFRDQQAALGVLNGLVEESITGGKAVHAYGREEAVIEEFDQANRRLRAAAIRAQTYSGLMGPGGNMVNNIGFAAMATAGAWMAVRGLATIGTVASFLNYAQQLRRPISDLASLFNTIQAALAGAERVFDILDEHPEIEDAPEALPLTAIAGKVVFDAVDFGYKSGVPVLRHVSLTAEPGQTIALVGPTGAGKTTIINLLSRFYDVDAGAIRIDDQDIRGVRKADLRRQLGVVLQDTFLFSESVKENIRYGRLDATDDEVIAAARLANADHFIHRLPHSYDTLLSERAGNLSQGQRQLLAIACAILADPRILVLDEATSSVDTRTEAQIQEALLRLMEGRTSFVVAHRLSTIREADKILVIRNGEIVEQGSHKALLAQEGFYYELYMSQFKGVMIPGSR
ncbi:MAG: ABC transporter ATP-binding protein [Chloroflexi bacterium]|nr:ABC transporter ATP-binding protein [Chloroflexota bacterium]